VLFDEDDVAEGLPKAIAAKRRLERINSQIEIEAIVADVEPGNIVRLIEGCDVLLDGTDNFETRLLLNDASLKHSIPWVYGGCIGATGQTMTIVPGETPCFRCLMPEPPPPGTTPTCDSAGIVGPIVNVVASLQAMEAMKILSGNRAAISRTLDVFELWESRIRQVKIDGLKAAGGCPACRGEEYAWLLGKRGSHTAVLCGRNAVQLSFPDREPVSLEALEQKLAGMGETRRNKFLLRASIDKYVITVFPDGRAIIGGTDDAAEARTVYAKVVGH
jgi:adenylyltransferase/sulfurtransferase